MRCIHHEARKTNPFLIAAVVIMVTGIVFSVMVYSERGYDDAYISYRYARNFVAGHGLVFNPGERVEGYSSLLYILMLAAGLVVVPAEYIYFLSLSLNIVLAAVSCIVFYTFVRDDLDKPCANAAVLIFALCTVFWRYAASGLETPLFLLLQLLTWTSVKRFEKTNSTRTFRALCTVMILSILARADGFVMPCMVVAYLALKRRYRAAAYGSLAIAVVMAAYIGFRYLYYGYPLPNTYYVKVAGALGQRIRYAANLLRYMSLANGMIPCALTILLTSVIHTVKNRSKGGRLLDTVSPELVFAAGWTLYWFYVGGDVLGDRFLIMLFPMGIYSALRLFRHEDHRRIAVLLVILMLANVMYQVNWDPRNSILGYVTMPEISHLVLAALLGQGLLLTAIATDRLPKKAGLLAVLVLMINLVFHPPISRPLYGSDDTRDIWIVLGRFLAERYPGRTIAVDAAGKVPYFSGLKTIDMLGLNDEHIAHLDSLGSSVPYRPGHLKYDPDYVYSRQPDLIAAWIDENLNLLYDMDQKSYETAGYRIAHLTGITGDPSGLIMPVPVLDVLDDSEDLNRRRVMRGLRYAVLVRADQVTDT